MSILSTLAGALEGAPNATPGGTPTLNPATAAAGGLVVSQIIAMIQNRPGGLGGLLQAFQQGGLGHVFQSWIGTGQNLPVSPDQLHSTLGTDWISRITQATGLPQSQVEQHLSTLLPQIIDHLTPGGQLPQGEIGGDLAKLAQRFLHG
ncbi:MAG: YidB family protein [Steroidobacteraceae bacterium]